MIFFSADVVIDEDVEGETMLGEGRIGVLHYAQSAPALHPHRSQAGLEPMTAAPKPGRRAVAGRIGSGGLTVTVFVAFALCSVCNRVDF